MKRQLLYLGLLSVILVLACAALCWSGNYVVYLLAYIFTFLFLLCRTIFSPSAFLEKLAQGLVYGLILAAQILFAVLILRPAAQIAPVFFLHRVLGVLIIFLPVLVCQIWRLSSRRPDQ